MSEGIAHGGYAPTPSRSQPAYGDGRVTYEPPAKGEEHLDRQSHAALAVTIFGPVVAAYGAIAYGVYLAAGVIL